MTSAIASSEQHIITSSTFKSYFRSISNGAALSVAQLLRLRHAVQMIPTRTAAAATAFTSSCLAGSGGGTIVVTGASPTARAWLFPDGPPASSVPFLLLLFFSGRRGGGAAGEVTSCRVGGDAGEGSDTAIVISGKAGSICPGTAAGVPCGNGDGFGSAGAVFVRSSMAGFAGAGSGGCCGGGRYE